MRYTPEITKSIFDIDWLRREDGIIIWALHYHYWHHSLRIIASLIELALRSPLFRCLAWFLHWRHLLFELWLFRLHRHFDIVTAYRTASSFTSKRQRVSFVSSSQRALPIHFASGSSCLHFRRADGAAALPSIFSDTIILCAHLMNKIRATLRSGRFRERQLSSSASVFYHSENNRHLGQQSLFIRMFLAERARCRFAMRRFTHHFTTSSRRRFQ